MFDHNIAIKAFGTAGINYLVNVPATNMNAIYHHYDQAGGCIYASREEEGVAICVGLAMTGKMPLLFIQQSGVGNMLNAYIGLAEAYEIYFPILVLDRGVEDENPVQAYSSLRTSRIISALDQSYHIDFSNEKCIDDLKFHIAGKNRWLITRY
jgi:sulfopyruvate decarboxylase